MSGEQKDDFLNEIVEAGKQSTGDGDAYSAWVHLRAFIEHGRVMPTWARQFFLRTASAMDAFDSAWDDPIDLLSALEIQYSPKMQQRKRKSKVDYQDIYRSVSYGRAKGLTVEQCVNEYIDKNDLPDELSTFDTVKSAYNTTRRERVAAMDQDRPHFKLPMNFRI